MFNLFEPVSYTTTCVTHEVKLDKGGKGGVRGVLYAGNGTLGIGESGIGRDYSGDGGYEGGGGGGSSFLPSLINRKFKIEGNQEVKSITGGKIKEFPQTQSIL